MGFGPKAVRDLLSELENGYYVIPHFQRDFAWWPSMVSDLLVSILHDYYAGTLLFWQLNDREKEYKMWDPLWGVNKSEKPTKAVLDGQQRLSSIYYAFCAPERTFPQRESYYYFFIDLDEFFLGNENESVFYRYYSKARSLDWFKLNEDFAKEGIFPTCLLSNNAYLDSIDFENWIRNYFNSSEIPQKLNLTNLTIANRIRNCLNYSFLTETLEDKEPKEICEIFARINSKGLKLNIFDLMNAFLYPSGIQLRKEWESLDNSKLKNVDPQMKVYLLKLMSLDKQIYCSSKFLSNLIPGSAVKDRHGNERVLIKNKDEFESLWRRSIQYSEKARRKIMNSGKSDFGAIKPSFIPNTTMLPVLGALILKYDSMKDEVSDLSFWKKIKKWYWCAILTGDYSGSSDSVMAKDYREVVQWLTDDTKVPERVKKVNSIFLENSVDLYNVRNTNTSQYSAVLNLLAIRSALDFYTGRQLGNYNLNEIQDHHIFPVKSGIQVEEKLKDCILNRTLLTAETNNKIKRKKPSEYVDDIFTKNNEDWSVVEKIMASHLISKKALKFLLKNDFKNFINERNKTIKEEFKKLVDIITKKPSRSLLSPETPFDNEQLYVSTIEACEDYVHIIDPFFNRNALKLLNKGIKHNDSIRSIKILSKVHNIDEEFKGDFRKFRKQLKNLQTHVELRVLLNPEDANKIHDRYLLTKNKSYNFVSADTVSRGQLSNITEVEGIQPIFDDLWLEGAEILGNWNVVMKKKKELKGNGFRDQVPEYIRQLYPDYKQHMHSAAMLTVLHEQHRAKEKAIDSYNLAKKMIAKFPKFFEGKTAAQVGNGNIFAGTNLLNRGLLKIDYKKYRNKDDEYRVYWM